MAACTRVWKLCFALYGVVGCVQDPKTNNNGATETIVPTTSTSSLSILRSTSTETRPIVSVSNILISYRGAEGASAAVTRSKPEAQALAKRVMEEAKSGKVSWENLVQQYSDDVSKKIGGKTGNFERNAMPKPFSDAAFALVVGEISDVVETPRGFFIIQRLK